VSAVPRKNRGRLCARVNQARREAAKQIPELSHSVIAASGRAGNVHAQVSDRASGGGASPAGKCGVLDEEGSRLSTGITRSALVEPPMSMSKSSDNHATTWVFAHRTVPVRI
jgi:hypothetical protein